MKIVRVRRFCLIVLVALTAGCAARPGGGGVTVEGALAGTRAGSASASPSTLTLSHRNGASLPRVSETPDPRIDDLTSMTLRVTSLAGGPFQDEFVLATMVASPAGTKITETESAGSENAGTDGRYDGDDPDWVRRRRGELAVLRLPVGDGSAGKTATRTFAAAKGRRAGSAWLMRLEGTDPVIPWTIDAGDGRCRAVSPSVTLVVAPAGQSRDCFDLETLAGMVLAHMAKAVTEGLDDGPLPALVTAAGHELSIVPALDAPGSAGGAGFGLIYAAALRIGEHASKAKATVLIPVTVHFRPASSPAGPDLEAVIAPLGSAPWSAIDASRVTLAHADGGVDAGLAREIRAVIVDSLERAALPPLNVDGAEVPAEQAIGRMVAAMAAQPATSPPSFARLGVVALPARRSGATEPIVPTRVLSLPKVSTHLSTGGAFGASGPNQTARPKTVAKSNGTVSVTTPLDPPGRIRRLTTLAPMRTGEPYELRILR